MNLSLETKALGWALLAAGLSLGTVWLLANTIKITAGHGPASSASTELVATPEIIAQGQDFYGQSCSQCHGDDAHGNEAPDLHHLTISNARIAKTIKNGIKGAMPAFVKKYNDDQIAVLVAYLRTLK